MIYGNSNDPILVKKIALRIWSLRDEVVAVVKSRLEGKSREEQIEEMKKIGAEYGSVATDMQAAITGATTAEGETVGDGDLDDTEDAMAALLSGGGEEAEEGEEAAEGEEEAPAEGEEEATAEGEEGEAVEGELDDSEDAMAALMGGGAEETEEIGEETESAQEGIIISRKVPPMPKEKIAKGKTLLSEINMDTMFFFGNKSFLEGQSIAIQFLIPRHFIVNAKVLYCRKFNIRSRIISENKLPYRMCIQFTFLKPGERTLLREFVKSIEPEIQQAAPKKAKQKEDDGGDDFEDFSELEDL